MLFPSPRNMIGQSQSGTGKTAAFVLTMLSRVDESDPVVQVCAWIDRFLFLTFTRLYALPLPENLLAKLCLS